MLNRFSSNTKKLNKVIQKINTNTLADFDLTGSLENIEIPSSKKYEAGFRSNPNPIKLVNNKNTITDFHQEILEHSARYIKRRIDEFDNELNTLTIRNVRTDYGTEGASPNNFEVLVYGLHIPGNYEVKEVGNNVVIFLKDNYIDYNTTEINDIYVIGKLVEIPLANELSYDLIIDTENNEDLIL